MSRPPSYDGDGDEKENRSGPIQRRQPPPAYDGDAGTEKGGDEADPDGLDLYNNVVHTKVPKTQPLQEHQSEEEKREVPAWMNESGLYRDGLDKTGAEVELEGKPKGTYLIRPSSKENMFTVSYVLQGGGIVHNRFGVDKYPNLEALASLVRKEIIVDSAGKAYKGELNEKTAGKYLAGREPGKSVVYPSKSCGYKVSLVCPDNQIRTFKLEVNKLSDEPWEVRQLFTLTSLDSKEKERELSCDGSTIAEALESFCVQFKAKLEERSQVSSVAGVDEKSEQPHVPQSASESNPLGIGVPTPSRLLKKFGYGGEPSAQSQPSKTPPPPLMRQGHLNNLNEVPPPKNEVVQPPKKGGPGKKGPGH